MIWHLFMIEDELGRRVGEGIGISADDVRGMAPLATQVLTEEELARAANLGRNGTRDTGDLVMTHCVPNEHEAIAPVEPAPERTGRFERSKITA
jgi:catalase